MKDKESDDLQKEMRDEYDFSKGIRGKYAQKFKNGCNIILLDPDLARIYPDSKSVNEALREYSDSA